MANAERPFVRKRVDAWCDLKAKRRGDAVVITAKCPICHHEIDDFVPVVAAQGEGSLRSVLSCNCESKHDGRPDGALGCGALSAVKITLPAADGDAPVAVDDDHPATLRERYWDQEAATYERAMYGRLAGIAEKWGQTVAAIFGLFGIALILEGNDKLGALGDSTATWPYYVLAAALVVVGVATLIWRYRREGRELEADDPAGWVGIAAYVVGVLALTVVEPLGADVAFGIAAGLAVALAVASTALAGFAAQGTPKRIAALTGQNMRERYHEMSAAVVRNLMRARWTTVWASVFLGLAVAIMWLAPQQSAASTNVRLTLTGGGGLPCGTLAATSGQRFAIDPGGGKPVEFYEFDEVDRVEPVSKC